MARTILQMRNLGPCCAEWLDGIGIHHETDLRSVAAAAAYPERIIRGIVRPHSCPFDTFGIQLRFASMVVQIITATAKGFDQRLNPLGRIDHGFTRINTDG